MVKQSPCDERVLALLDAPELDGGVVGELESLGPSAVSFLVQTASDAKERPYLRARAVDALGALRAADALDPVRKLLADPDVAGHAVHALAEIAPEAAAEELRHLLQQNVGREVQAHAADVLGAIGDRRAIASLQEWAAGQDELAAAVADRAVSRLQRRRR